MSASPHLRRAIIIRLEEVYHLRVSDRLVADAIAGYPCRSLDDIRQAAEECGFKWSQVPKRSEEEILAWKLMRQPKCKVCDEKDAAINRLKKRLAEARAEIEVLQRQLEEAPSARKRS